MSEKLVPTMAQLEQLQKLPGDAPLAVLNLFQFNAQARYVEGDPEFGTAEADVTGEQAYARYGAVAGPTIVALGGRIVFSSPVEQVMIGPLEPAWDVAAIMFFPAREDFSAMLADPEFQLASRHRKAAMANHHMIHLGGAPFIEQT